MRPLTRTTLTVLASTSVVLAGISTVTPMPMWYVLLPLLAPLALVIGAALLAGALGVLAGVAVFFAERMTRGGVQ